MNAKTLATVIILGIAAFAGVKANGQQTYSNPVINNGCSNPSLIDDRSRSGWFYVYSEQTDAEILPVYRSKDLVHWQFAGDVFAGDKPEWTGKTDITGPNINYINGRYVIFYTVKSIKNLANSGIGVAVADSPEGPFTDKGRLLDMKTAGTVCPSDPYFWADESGNYLYWSGKTDGLCGIQMSDDGINIAEGAKKVRLGASNMSAPTLHKRGGWYYLFASTGPANDNLNSIYHIVVARSESPLGPFAGPDGQSMKKSGYKYAILSGSLDKSFLVPGHNTCIITDDNGDNWMLYHSFNSDTKYSRKALNLDQIRWTAKEWPYFETGEPSDMHAAPVLVKPVEKFEPNVRIVLPVTEVAKEEPKVENAEKSEQTENADKVGKTSIKAKFNGMMDNIGNGAKVAKDKTVGAFKKAGSGISSFFKTTIPNTVSDMSDKLFNKKDKAETDESKAEVTDETAEDISSVTATSHIKKANGIKAEEKAAEKVSEKKAEKAAEKTVEAVADKATEKVAEKSAEKAAEKAVQKAVQKKHLVGGYTEQREITAAELAMFNKLTSSSAMKFTPVSVATQVVAGTNYKFISKCGDAAGIASAMCEIVIYQPLQGSPSITSMELIRE